MAETDPTTLLADAAARAARYLSEIQDRPVAPTREALAGLARLAPPLPEPGMAAERVLALLDEAGSPATLGTAGPRFFGFVIGGSLPATVAASILAAAWDQNAGLRVTSPVAAALEDAAITWLLDLLAPAARHRRRLRHLRHHRQPERPGGRPPRAARARRAGTSKRTACSARRRCASSSATRCT